jgi:hypothetical protein
VDLAPLEETLSQHLDDPRFWAVYADALAESQPGSLRASAVRQALQGGPGTPGIPYEPQQLEVDWHYGHWRAVRVTGSLPLRRVLEHNNARFLVHLLLPLRQQYGLEGLRLPRTLQHLALEGTDRWPDLGELGALGPQLRELRAPGLSLEALSGVPQLARLELDMLSGCSAPCPSLRSLSVHAPGLPSLLALEPSLVPALDTLVVRGDLERDSLWALLSSPLGQQLRRLEVCGSGLSIQLAERPQLWAHLAQLVVNDDTEGAPALPRLCVRRELEVELDPNQGFCLRLPPPCTPLAAARAVQAASEELGLRLEGQLDRAVDGLLLPQEVVFPMARLLAARERVAVHVIEGATTTEFTPEGLIRRISSGFSPWAPGERSFVAEVPEYDLERSELEADLHVVEKVERDDDYGDYDSSSEDDRWEDEPTFLGSRPDVWVPRDWQPDPLAHAPSMPHFPRSLRPVNLGTGQPEGAPLPLEDSLGSYVCWRAFAACLLEELPLPEVSRWTTRMLRRHRLEEEPSEPGHPFWQDWRSVSVQERSMRASVGQLPAYKLASPGRWILDGPEARLLASALRQRIPHHTPPEGHRPGLAALVELLSAGRPLEVTVG